MTLAIDPDKRIVQFFVAGKPAPGGSKISGVSKSGKGFVRPDNPNTAVWKSVVSYTALQNRPDELLSGPIQAKFHFFMQRPKDHYNSKGQLKAGRDIFCWKKPDLDKLVRSTADALTGICYRDDAQIVNLVAYKIYGIKTGCQVIITEKKERSDEK